MSNKEILKKAIEKAVKNGWSYKVNFGKLYEKVGEDLVILTDPLTLYSISFALNTIIFSHDFAKAFWGEEKLRVYSCCGKSENSSYDKEG